MTRKLTVSRRAARCRGSRWCHPRRCEWFGSRAKSAHRLQRLCEFAVLILRTRLAVSCEPVVMRAQRRLVCALGSSVRRLIHVMQAVRIGITDAT